MVKNFKIVFLSSFFFFAICGLAFAVENEAVIEDSSNSNNSSSSGNSDNGRNLKVQKDEIKAQREAVKNENQERKEQFKQDMSEVREKRCDLVEARIKNRVERYETNQEHNNGLFNNLTERVDKLIEKYKEKGYDVTKVEQDANEIKQKIEVLSQNHEAFVNSLKESEGYACGKSEGEFATKLRSSRSLIPQIRANILEIREYYRDVLRPDLLDLKEQIKESNREKVNNNLSTENRVDGQSVE